MPAPTSSRSSARPRSRCSTTCRTARPPRATAARSRRRRTSRSSAAPPTRRRSTTAATSTRRTTRRASAWRRSRGWAPSSASTCCSTTRCTGSSSATSTRAATSSTSTSRAGSSRAPGIIINTGEDNYLTTADAVEKAHTVLAASSSTRRSRSMPASRTSRWGSATRYEIDPSIENSFLLELAQAQLIRQVFPRHPIKWMPPTKFKTGDIFQSHVHDALFSLVGVTTHQSIELLGMFSEAVHNPMLMDRYLSLKAHEVRLQHGQRARRRDRDQARRHHGEARRAGARRGARAPRRGGARHDLGGHRAEARSPT